MRDTIVELKQTMKDAAARQDQAKQDTKRIEKDMNEFKNNKDSKLQQLQVLSHEIQLRLETSRSTEGCSKETGRNNQSETQRVPNSAARK